MLFSSLRPGKITVCLIGKIINPLFLFFLAALMLVALSLRPARGLRAVEPVEAHRRTRSSLRSLRLAGTMDAIAGLPSLASWSSTSSAAWVWTMTTPSPRTVSSGLLTGALMALIYVVSIVVGAQSRGLFELSENGGIALTQIAGHYLGGVGLFILAFTITFACLKTSIGLVTACAETFSKMTNGKISYRSWAILFTVFSFAVSNIGLSAIIEYSIPMLMLIYPPAIALILLAFLGKFFSRMTAPFTSRP